MQCQEMLCKDRGILWNFGMTEPSVFISYSHEDAEVAGRVESALRAAGMAVWIDEGGLLGGDILIEQIASEIDVADFVVALVSQSAIQSNWCKKEISLAVTGGIRGGKVKVIPLLLGSLDLPPVLADAVYLEYKAGEENESCEKLIHHIHRHFESAGLDVGNDGVIEVPVSPLHSAQENTVAHRSRANTKETAFELESGLLSKMDRTRECAVILSLVSEVPGSVQINAQMFGEIRQSLLSRRVIPTSPFVDWLHIEIGPHRYILDGGAGSGGMKFCAAELLTDGSGVFAFMVRPSPVSTVGENFVFDDEVLVASVLGGLWLLGEHAARRAEAAGPYLIRVGLICPEEYQGIQPGHARGMFPRNIWSGTYPLATALGEVDLVDAASVIEPSSRFMGVAYRLVSELLQSFGMPECPQIDQQGRVRIKYWGREFSGELVAWAGRHQIEISEDILPN